MKCPYCNQDWNMNMECEWVFAQKWVVKELVTVFSVRTSETIKRSEKPIANVPKTSITGPELAKMIADRIVAEHNAALEANQ
ncbi:hypothetical protein LCGC14_1499900 [marine sediment metagenome]|uniref:Uncharacterized protein n=1 Tax=marine sediment metagenome TaxID=412755 RepID=A0A0F9J4X1_9ZZZZ